MDIFTTRMQFLRENVMFYDAINMIHDVITTANPFPYTLKFIFVSVRNDKTQQIRREKINRIRIWCCRISKIYVYGVAIYQKYLTRLGEMIIFEPRQGWEIS